MAGTRHANAHVVTGNAYVSGDLEVGGDLILVDDLTIDDATVDALTVTDIALANDMTITDAGNVILGTTTGSKIGTATTQKLGFFNATPVVQQTAVADAAGGATVDAEARTALNALLARLRTLGLIAT